MKDENKALTNVEVPKPKINGSEFEQQSEKKLSHKDMKWIYMMKQNYLQQCSYL